MGKVSKEDFEYFKDTLLNMDINVAIIMIPDRFNVQNMIELKPEHKYCFNYWKYIKENNYFHAINCELFGYHEGLL
jgi:hypothetical protein